MNNYIFFGTQITASHSIALQSKAMSEIVSMIKGEIGDLKEETRRLHNIKRLDINGYKRAKTILPYICAGEFQNGTRKSENFIQAHACILDFDNCIQNIEEANDLKEILDKRPDVNLAYISPSGKGIKIVYLLDQPISDNQTFMNFYKNFATKTAKSLNLFNFIDLKCHDTTRVSFISYDPNPVYNPVPDPIRTQDFIIPNLELEISDNILTSDSSNETVMNTVSQDQYSEILSVLNPKYHHLKSKPLPFVPEILQHIQPIIQEAIQQFEIKILECTPIQYGLKFRFAKNIHVAEINIFYGKKGFSVVASPKRDTHPKLNELVHKVIFMQLQEIQISTQTLINELQAQ